MTGDQNAEPQRLDQLMISVRKRLELAGVDTPVLDARLLVEWITRTTQLDMIARPEMCIDPEYLMQLEEALERRIAGEPVHRIMGIREFYGLPFRLSSGTLEPRPDTESLVELVASYTDTLVAQHGLIEVLDMGTGSGAIIISLLHRFEHMHGVGLDQSDDALATARVNAALNGVSSRFAALKSDWFSAVSGKFHMIVSNPPYIPHADINGLSREVREYDPMAALDGGGDGLDFYRALAEEGGQFLYKGGLVAVEIGAGQYDDVSGIFDRAGYSLLETARDLGGHRRAMIFSCKEDH